MSINLGTEANKVDKVIIAYLAKLGISNNDFDTNFTISGKSRPDVAIKDKNKKYCIIFENKKDFKDLGGAKGQGLDYLQQLNKQGLLSDKILLIRTNMMTFHSDEYFLEDGQIKHKKEIFFDLLEDLTLEIIKSYTNPSKIIEERKLLSTDKKELKKAFDGINNFLRYKGLGMDQRLHITMAVLFLKLIKENTDLLESIEEGKSKKTLINKIDNIKQNPSELNIIEVFDAINNIYDEEFHFDMQQYENKNILVGLFEIVNKVGLSNYDLDIKGEAFEYFINYGNTSSDMGEYFTPRHLVRFMVRLLDKAFQHNRETLFGKTYFDPTCGTGGFLIEIFKQVKNELKTQKKDFFENIKILKEKTVYGNELNLRSSEIAKMNMILTGDGHSNINQGDFITLKEERKNRYDVTIGNPPFGNNRERKFVDGFLKDVKVGGYSIFLVPEGVLFKSNKHFVDIRRTLLNKGKLLKVISLPQGTFLPYTGVKTDILFWKNEEQIEDYDIEFIDIKNDGFSLDANRRELQTSDLEEYFTDKQKLIDNGQVRTVNSSEIFDIKKLNELEIEKSKVSFESKNLDKKVKIIKSQIKIIENEQEKLLKQKRLKELEIELKKYKQNEKKLSDKIKSFDLSLVVNRYKPIYKLSKNIKVSDLGDIAEITNGFAFKSDNFNKDGKGLPIIRIHDLDNGISKNTVFWDNDYDKKYIVNNGDYLISLSGSFKIEERKYGKGLLNQRIIKVIFNEEIINKKLALYLIKSKLEEISSRATKTSVGNISINDIKSFKIPIPSFEYQQKIVEELERYQKIIDGNKQSIENYEPKIDIKDEWKIVELGDVVDLNPPKNEIENKDQDLNVSFVPMCDLQEHQKYFVIEKEKKIQEVCKGYTYFKDNDVLVAKITPCFENGKSGIAKNLKNGIGFGSTEYFVLRPNKLVIPDWIYYFISKKDFIEEGKSYMSGSAGQQRVNKSYILNTKIPLPPLSEQEEIVAKLEEEQELINANKKLVELFENKIKMKVDKLRGIE